jgi:hypothetical protein
MLRAARAARRRHLSSFRQRIPGCGWRSVTAEDGPNAPAAAGAAGIRIRDSEQRHADDDHLPPTVLTWLRLSAQNAVLPNGYPHTVRNTYPAYVRYTALGLFTGRIQSVLATQAMLFTVGLGAGAIPMAAAIQWVLKDGIGHAGAIAYAAAVNTKFDADAKKYRFQSTVALTAGDFLAIAMPLVPNHFLLMASLSSTIGSIAGLAQTASRARVMSAFALVGNLADCTRAGQTQGKLMSIFGTSAGAALSWVIGPEPLHVAACMVPLAGLSLYSMHVSSRLVVLRSFNVQRAERTFARILSQLPRDLGVTAPAGVRVAPAAGLGVGRADRTLRVPSPEEIADTETFAMEYHSVFATELLLQPLIGGPPTGGWRLALPFAKHVEANAVIDLLRPPEDARAPKAVLAAGQRGERRGGHEERWAASWQADGMYAIAVHSPPDGSRRQVLLWHGSRNRPREKLQALWHACVVRHVLDHRGQLPFSLEAAHAAALGHWPAVYSALVEADWNLEAVYLDGVGASIELNGGEQQQPAAAA